MERVESGRLEVATLESEISMSVATEGDHRQQGQRPNMSNGGRENEKDYMCGILNVEPVLALLSISLGLFITSHPLFTYWARCVEVAEIKNLSILNATATCSSIVANNNTQLQDLVERDISSTKIYLQLASSAPTILVAPLVGTWSDKRGRKKPLIVAIFGFTLYSIGYLMATLTYLSMNVYTWFFLSEITLGLTGGLSTVFMTVLAIITDDSRHKLKPGSSSVPLRIGFASATQSIGTLLGTLVISCLSAPTIESIVGHEQSYIKAAFLQCMFVFVAFLYAIIFVKETHHPNTTDFVHEGVDRDSRRLQNSHERGNSDGLFVGPMKEHLYTLLEVLLQRRPGWARLCLNLSIFLVFVEFLANDTSLLFLLVKRQPFAWSDSMFSIYNVVKGVCISLGMVLGPLSLSKINMVGKDSVLIMIGTGAASLSFFLIAFSNSTFQLFITSSISLFAGCVAPAFRSLLPRMVPKEQTARLLTVTSIAVAFCPIMSALIFNSIFNLTIDWWAGFVFFVSAIFLLVTVFGQITIHSLMYSQWKKDKELKEQGKITGENEGDSEDSRESSVAVRDTRSVSNVTTNGSCSEEFQDDQAPLIT